ncbi:MAG TPA: hypothetical protein VFL62_01065 [Bradyrhizobium sp.]|uniref:hypothetical protein n=1 Tax=Bradyrhizobium sp. TaxID=376 RepID=UPI002D7F8700|nr:hypothetical protein [Bradyrhizobium sp.]HET7884791.1 hypothetical protein [Bradyrhizobium sp.]
MSSRIDKSWTVIASLENAEHDKCVDIFSRPDGSYGFEEFRRDVEDRGRWTPLQTYSALVCASPATALATAERTVTWLAPVLSQTPDLRTRIAAFADQGGPAAE